MVVLVRRRIRAKKQDREQDEIERLEKEVRELKAINRSLMKQLKKLAKGIHKQEVEEALEKLEENGPKKEDDRRECPNCGRTGGLRELILANRRFERCDICDYKSGKLK